MRREGKEISGFSLLSYCDCPSGNAAAKWKVVFPTYSLERGEKVLICTVSLFHIDLGNC